MRSRKLRASAAHSWPRCDPGPADTGCSGDGSAMLTGLPPRDVIGRRPHRRRVVLRRPQRALGSSPAGRPASLAPGAAAASPLRSHREHADFLSISAALGFLWFFDRAGSPMARGRQAANVASGDGMRRSCAKRSGSRGQGNLAEDRNEFNAGAELDRSRYAEPCFRRRTGRKFCFQRPADGRSRPAPQAISWGIGF